MRIQYCKLKQYSKTMEYDNKVIIEHNFIMKINITNKYNMLNTFINSAIHEKKNYTISNNNTLEVAHHEIWKQRKYMLKKFL